MRSHARHVELDRPQKVRCRSSPHRHVYGRHTLVAAREIHKPGRPPRRHPSLELHGPATGRRPAADEVEQVFGSRTPRAPPFVPRLQVGHGRHLGDGEDAPGQVQGGHSPEAAPPESHHVWSEGGGRGSALYTRHREVCGQADRGPGRMVGARHDMPRARAQVSNAHHEVPPLGRVMCWKTGMPGVPRTGASAPRHLVEIAERGLSPAGMVERRIGVAPGSSSGSTAAGYSRRRGRHPQRVSRVDLRVAPSADWVTARRRRRDGRPGSAEPRLRSDINDQNRSRTTVRPATRTRLVDGGGVAAA